MLSVPPLALYITYSLGSNVSAYLHTLQAFLATVLYTLMGWEEVDNEAARYVVSGRFGPLRNVRSRLSIEFACYHAYVCFTFNSK